MRRRKTRHIREQSERRTKGRTDNTDNGAQNRVVTPGVTPLIKSHTAVGQHMQKGLFYLGAPFLISGHMHATLCHSVGQSVGLLVCWSVFLVSVILVAK